MTWVLDFVYFLAAVLFTPVLLYQRYIRKKMRTGWGQRFGGVPRRPVGRPCVWVHAVSLGEANATVSLTAELRRRLPDHDVVVSTTTDTGYAAAVRHYGEAAVFRYPLDFSFAVRRALERIRPAAVVLMELEVWPNFIDLAARRGVAVGIANGRVTEEKSMRRFRKPVVRTLARRMFGQLAFVAAQDEAYAPRFVELGTPPERVRVCGNLKFDTAVVADRIAGDDALAAALGIDRSRPLLVAGSTGPDEEALLLDVYARLKATVPGLQLAIIPRKPERFDEVARLIESRGHGCVRRNRRPDGADAGPAAPGAVFLGDTMGELRKFYSLADAVFVGRTLAPLGGSDLMEVAALGKAMCFGPHVENFADAAARLLAERAAEQVPDVDGLATCLQRLLTDRDAARSMGAQAREVVRQCQGATARTVDWIIEAMGKADATTHSP